MTTKQYLTLGFIFITLNCFNQESWLQVEAGTEYSVGLRADSTLWTWGTNGNGQLGNNLATITENSPILVAPSARWKFIAAGSFHAFAIRNDGTLWAWGLNGNGQLGTGDNIQKNKPTQIGTATDWKFIDAGQAHTFGIKNNGTLWAWGLNFYGSLGLNSTQDKNIPTQVGTGTNWSTISCGGLHSIATKTNGTLWATGFNANGQLGDSTIITDSIFKQIGTATNWKDAQAGFEFSVGIRSDGSIYSWGFNGDGQLGDSTFTQKIEPINISAGMTWNNIYAGSSFSYGIKNDSTLWSWGYNQFGQLGDGTTTHRAIPLQIDLSTNWLSISPAEGAISGVSVFGHHTFGLKSHREGICFAGANYTGQAGTGNTINSVTFNCARITTSLDKNISTEINITFFPNPTNGIVTIKSDKSENLTFEVINSLGQKIVTEKTLFQSNKIDLTSNPTGIYLLLVKENDVIIKSTRIIRN